MKWQDDPTIERLRRPLNDQSDDGVASARAIWPTTDGNDLPVKDQSEREPVSTQADSDTDRVMAHYFGDVRQFVLLTRAEEEVLWQRIEHLQQRLRRALYTAPVCLPTLQKLWRQVERGERSLGDVVAQTASAVNSDAARSVPFQASIRSLQELMRRHRRLKARKQQSVANSAQTRRPMRQAEADLWHQWIAVCETLQLQPSAHQELSRTLEGAFRNQPDDVALRAAYRNWSRTQRALEEAKARMLRANLRLVIYVAKRYDHNEVPLLDLIQEGNIGLMRALEKFEPSRGLKFVTYAHWWVRQAIGRAIIEQRRTVRLPCHVVERKNKLRAAETKLWQVHKRAPTLSELSAELGWTPQEVEVVLSTGQVMVRLHDPLSEDGQRLDETMEDEQSPAPDVVVAQRQLQQQIADCLCELPEREAHILRLRFGLDTDRSHSLKEIGERYGLSRERIRQIEMIALKKLRHSKHGALLADFADVD